MILRYLVPATDAYETVESNISIMDEPYAQVLEYRAYLLSMYVVLNTKDILEISIFVFGGNKECLNGALEVVDSDYFS